MPKNVGFFVVVHKFQDIWNQIVEKIFKVICQVAVNEIFEANQDFEPNIFVVQLLNHKD